MLVLLSPKPRGVRLARPRAGRPARVRRVLPGGRALHCEGSEDIMDLQEEEGSGQSLDGFGQSSGALQEEGEEGGSSCGPGGSREGSAGARAAGPPASGCEDVRAHSRAQTPGHVSWAQQGSLNASGSSSGSSGAAGPDGGADGGAGKASASSRLQQMQDLGVQTRQKRMAYHGTKPEVKKALAAAAAAAAAAAEAAAAATAAMAAAQRALEEEEAAAAAAAAAAEAAARAARPKPRLSILIPGKRSSTPDVPPSTKAGISQQEQQAANSSTPASTRQQQQQQAPRSPMAALAEKGFRQLRKFGSFVMEGAAQLGQHLGLGSPGGSSRTAAGTPGPRRAGSDAWSGGGAGPVASPLGPGGRYRVGGEVVEEEGDRVASQQQGCSGGGGGEGGGGGDLASEASASAWVQQAADGASCSASCSEAAERRCQDSQQRAATQGSDAVPAGTTDSSGAAGGVPQQGTDWLLQPLQPVGTGRARWAG